MALYATNALTTTKSSSTEPKVKILLIGDSTTEGGKPVFENSIEELVAIEDSVPVVEVINAGKGGETAHSLLNSGRYESDIKGIDSVDYIFVRYGINDYFKRQPFTLNFPTDMKKVIDQLEVDFPSAEIIMMTIVPFLGDLNDQIVNEQIVEVASEKGLELFDLYTPYKEKMDEFGKPALTIRFFPLSGIPKNYHQLVEPYASFYEWKNAVWVRVQSNEFDPLFGHLTDWYKDNHPNTTGYRLIADETVKYILPKLKN